MKLPEKREQIGEQISTARSVSTATKPPQKLSMAALIAKRKSNINNDTTSPSSEEARFLIGSSRANVSRDLKLPISMDITKIISDDSAEEIDEEEDDDDEEEDMPEVLPEVSEKLITQGSVDVQLRTEKEKASMLSSIDLGVDRLVDKTD